MATITSDVRNRGLSDAVTYKGKQGMLAWALHRATGLGILLFLIIHVVDTAIVVINPEFYDKSLDIYRHPVFRVGELLIFFSVLYHAVNGTRIVVQDFWPVVMQRQKQFATIGAIIVALAMIPITWMMMGPVLGLAEEPGVERHEQRCAENPTVPACVDESSLEVEP